MFEQLTALQQLPPAHSISFLLGERPLPRVGLGAPGSRLADPRSKLGKASGMSVPLGSSGKWGGCSQADLSDTGKDDLLFALKTHFMRAARTL